MKKFLVFAVSGVFALGIAACGDDDDENGGGGGGGGGGDLSGEIVIDGSSTVGPFAQAAAEQFRRENPDVQDLRRHLRHRRRLREVLRRRDRHLRRLASDRRRGGGPDLQEERRRRTRSSRSPTTASSIVTNPALEVECMTTKQLKEALEHGLEGRSRSASIDPTFPDTELKLYGPGTDSGTFEFFTDEINGEEGDARKDYQPSEDDNVLVQGVAGDEGGLGYFGFSYYEQNQDKLNLVGVDAGDGCVDAERRDDRRTAATSRSRGRCSCTSSEKSLQAARGQGVHGLRARQLRDDLGDVADRAAVARAGRRRPKARPLGARLEARRPQRQRARRPHWASRAAAVGEDIIKALLILAALISVLTTTGIVLSLLRETIVFFGDVRFGDFLFGTEWSPLFQPASLRRPAAGLRARS